MKIKQYHWSVIYLFLVVISALLVWLNQHSVNAYWQQTYHRPSWLQRLDEYAWWRSGGTLKLWLMNEVQPDIESTDIEQFEVLELEENNEAPIEIERRKYARNGFGEPFIQDALSRLGYELDFNEPMSGLVNSPHPLLNVGKTFSRPLFEQAVHPNEILTKLILQNESEKSEQEEKIGQMSIEENESEILGNEQEIDITEKTKEDSILETETHHQEQDEVDESENYPNKIRLSKNDMVFFAGDSLMQGVAPYVQQWLTNNAIKSINLSKQSTGLSYPKFFNWPATIEETLQKNPDIKLLVMFLGPNDPWDFPHPEKPKSKYLRFKEAEWESVYRQRISHILETAKKLDVNVIWLQIPHMRAPKLNTQMAYLNEVLETEVHNRALFIPIKSVLSGGKNEYRDSILVDGKEMRVRSKDGIHFTPSGMKLIANHIIQHIELSP